MRKYGTDRASLEDTILFEDDEHLIVPAVIAREMVHPYPQGKAYKPAKELENAAWTADGRWITTEKHPDTQLLVRANDIKGKILEPRFVKNLIDPKTKRPMDRGIRVKLDFYKPRVSPMLIEELKNGQRQDVSIGFLYDQDDTPGEFRGIKYDFIQRNIFIDHVAAGVPVGRCPAPFCGIGMDELFCQRNIGLDPYGSISELPDQVKVLPKEAQEMFLKVVNAALEQYKDEEDAEERAFKVAWAAIKKKWEKDDSKWIKKEGADMGDQKGEPKDNKQRFMDHFEITEEQHTTVLSILGDKIYGLLPERGTGLEQELFMKACVDGGKTREDCIELWKKEHPEGAETDQEREAKAAATKKRCAKYPTSFKEGKGHHTKPSEYEGVSEAMFADPCNWKYPMDDEHIMAAWAYVNKPENRTKGGYSDAEWSWMQGRIKKRMKAAGHKVKEDVKPVDQLARSKKLLEILK